MKTPKEVIFNKINEFINTIDNFEDVVEGEEFVCYPDTNEIEIDLVNVDLHDDFYYNLMERTDKKDISIFTWSILHEVGHCMTYHFLDKRAYNHCQYIKRKIEQGKISATEYYSLADEKRATNWAIKFVDNNYDEVKKFDNDIRGYLYANL